MMLYVYLCILFLPHVRGGLLQKGKGCTVAVTVGQRVLGVRIGWRDEQMVSTLRSPLPTSKPDSIFLSYPSVRAT